MSDQLLNLEDAEKQVQEAIEEIAILNERIQDLYDEIDHLEVEKAEWRDKHDNAQATTKKIHDSPEYRAEIKQYYEDQVRREYERQRLIARYGTDKPVTIRDFFEQVKAFSPRIPKRLRELNRS
jgi:regulator of replication initiation timing